jgi:catechol 2,3-dioxygenase-like lactoylglutathione lyase family enzyme
MPALPAGSRPSQIKVAVDNVDAAVAFYVQAFGFRYEVVRRTEQSDYSAFMFGTYGQDNFFLMHLIAGQDPRRSACWSRTSTPATLVRWTPGQPRPWPRTHPRACPDAPQSAPKRQLDLALPT